MSRIIIVHGWGAYPQKDWHPWLIKTLEENGYEVVAPKMPDSLHPQIDRWVPYLSEIVGQSQENDIFIGHSIGCQTILRYLETLPENQKVNKVILVAPWVLLTEDSFEDEEDQEIAKPWLETSIDFEKVKQKANKFIAIFSDNDPYVGLDDNRKIFEQKLGAEIRIEHNQGHFSSEDGVTELPELLSIIA